MFHVKHDNSLNKPTTPTTTQNPYGEAHPKKHTPSKYTHRKRITKKQSRIMTDREVEPHSSNSQKELPTILRFHVKHQLLGNNGRKNSSQKPSPHNSSTPSYVSRETHWHPWDVVKQKQRFTWNKWVVVKTSCFTWNIEKPSNTRKHNQAHTHNKTKKAQN